MSHGIIRPVERALSIGEVQCERAVGFLASPIGAMSLVATIAGLPVEQLVACPLAYTTLTKHRNILTNVCEVFKRDAV